MCISSPLLIVLAVIFCFAGPVCFSIVVIIDDYYSIKVGSDVLLISSIVASVQLVSSSYLLWKCFRKQVWQS